VDSFQQEAGQLVTFLTALGGAAVTVLTLVLALDRERVDRRIFQLLPAALIAATFAAFVSANLMVFTSGLPESPPVEPAGQPGAGPVPSDLRLFLVALTTVHTATALLLFALVLLPAVYDVQGGTGVAQRLGFWSFLVIEVAAGAGVLQAARWRHYPEATTALAVSGGMAVALIVYFALRSPEADEGVQIFPFILCTAAVGAAGVYFAATFDRRQAPDSLDLWFFCLASMLPTAALIGLAIRVYREGYGRAGPRPGEPLVGSLSPPAIGNRPG
jgi:hypothetical protein